MRFDLFLGLISYVLNSEQVFPYGGTQYPHAYFARHINESLKTCLKKSSRLHLHAVTHMLGCPMCDNLLIENWCACVFYVLVILKVQTSFVFSKFLKLYATLIMAHVHSTCLIKWNQGYEDFENLLN